MKEYLFNGINVPTEYIEAYKKITWDDLYVDNSNESNSLIVLGEVYS